MAWYSQTWTWFEGKWLDGNPALMGPRSHAFWLASSVFDGARVFEGVMPDMDLHAARVNRSARTLGLLPTMEAEAIVELTREGARKFGPDAALYVKPMYWAEADGLGTIAPDPNSTRFCLCLFEAPMPVPGGFSVTKGAFRRPTLETMPTDSKSGCLYPNNARVLLEARSRGFDNALVLDMLGNVAETATSNVFMAKDGAVFTPAPNGTFLNGITRQRVIRLLRDAGVTVNEATLRYEDFETADEIFISGNYSKVMPVLKIDGRELQPGPFYRKARELYWAFAHDKAGKAAA
ncbi:branched-chain amino acid aminotransferase [Chelatococcus sp. SYSU_G07232]|uniref:Probable branched-chain-amino-acid aminotransferase n=1 Tax=Chelatococcus albus TaxID=3047466 RepID=A0ABT7AJ75_9HYPH|nr:branched-chain amino acid aminotransferase [Chelatococcus sp. SYSU_G07232]MDJ1159413.1 branched-chain amino acid aminotransferase [Chelatococcus sp. SYSU_G07232]